MSIRSRAIERFQALLHFRKDYVRSRRVGVRPDFDSYYAHEFL